MAFDEYCLEQAPSDEPLFYLWQNRPAVIIGLNQNPYAEVDLPFLEREGIALARRVTGGGAVYHDLGNLNYTITGRTSSLRDDYPEFLYLVRDAVRALGVPVELSGRNDLMLHGRKCSGFAKRLWKDRLMIHGTLLFDVDLDTMTRALAAPGGKFAAKGIASVHSKVVNLKEFLPGIPDMGTLRRRLTEILSDGDSPMSLPASAPAAVDALADGKFRAWEWNFGHSPAAAFRLRDRFPGCGTVEAAFDLVKGCLSGLRFHGDFLGELPAEALAERLEGCPFDRAALAERIAAGSPCNRYFDHVSNETFLTFLTSLPDKSDS